MEEMEGRRIGMEEKYLVLKNTFLKRSCGAAKAPVRVCVKNVLHASKLLPTPGDERAMKILCYFLFIITVIIIVLLFLNF